MDNPLYIYFFFVAIGEIVQVPALLGTHKMCPFYESVKPVTLKTSFLIPPPSPPTPSYPSCTSILYPILFANVFIYTVTTNVPILKQIRQYKQNNGTKTK